MLRAVAKRDLRTLIAAVDDERLVFLRGLKTWPVFGAGWARRVAEVRAAALRMADVAPKEKVRSTSAPKVTAGTIAVAGAAAAQQAHSAGVEPAIIAVIVGAAAGENPDRCAGRARVDASRGQHRDRAGRRSECGGCRRTACGK